MNLSDTFKQIVGAVAPVLGTALGGPLGGAAASSIATALLGKPDATTAELETAIKTATPEQLAELKKLDYEFKIKMEEMGLDLERLNQQGIADARAREVAVKDKLPALLAVGITLGYLAVLFFMLTYGVPENGGDALLILLGALGGSWGSVVTYYFGSSAGSMAKTELLRGKA